MERGSSCLGNVSRSDNLFWLNKSSSSYLTSVSGLCGGVGPVMKVLACVNRLGFSALSFWGTAVVVRRRGEGRWPDRDGGAVGREKFMVLGRKLFRGMRQWMFSLDWALHLQ